MWTMFGASLLDTLKALLVSGNFGLIAIDAADMFEMATLDNFNNADINHAQTIIGYDDTVSYSEEGETRYGAFKVVNSWGPGWSGDGCWWISYKALEQRVGFVDFYHDRIGYNPETVAVFEIEHPVRGERFEPDDPRMRALEAYIYAQRKGKPLNYGKH